MAEQPVDSDQTTDSYGNKPYRRRRILQTTGAGLAIGLAGCSGGGNSGNNGGNGGTTAGTNTTSGSASTETKKLRFLAPVAVFDGLKKAWQDMANKYAKENNVEVSIEVVGFGKFLATATKAASGGNPYDLMVATGATNLFTLQSQGLIQPVTDVANEMGGSDYFADPFYSYGNFNGEQWSLAMGTTGTLQWTRTDLANQVGYDIPSGTDTFRWDEYANLVGKITDQVDNTAGHAFSLKSSYLSSVYPWVLLNSNGGLLVSPDGGSIEFDSEATRQTMQYMRDQLYSTVAASPTSYAMVDTRTLFENGQAANIWFSAFHLPWDLEHGAESLQGKVGVFPHPTRKSSQDPTARVGSENVVIGKGIDHPDAAKGFLKYMMQPENAIKWHHGRPMGWVPTQNPLLNSKKEELYQPDVYSKYGDLYDQYISNTKSFGKPTIYEGGKPTLATARVLSNFALINCVQDILLNGKDINSAVSQYAKKMEQYL